MALTNTTPKTFKVTVLGGTTARASSVFENSRYEVDASGALYVYEGGDEPKTTVFGPSFWVRIDDPAPAEKPSAPRRVR